MLGRNTQLPETLSFLGGGCWQHYVPAVVRRDRRTAREFVTAYYGETYTDHGKLQALFEYASLIGELVELDAVSQPTYDWAHRRGDLDLHGGPRSPGRRIALVPASIVARARSVDRGVLRGRGSQVEAVPFDDGTGLLDLAALRARSRRRRRLRLRREPGLPRA